MEKGNMVKIVEVCRIPPSSQESSEVSLPLAAFDWLFMWLPPIQRILFYPLTDTHNSFIDSIIPKLKRSLSLTLAHFLPLAGNLLWPENSPLPFVLYSPNDAVSFTVAEADSGSDFHHVSGSQPREIKDSLPFIPVIQPSDDAVPIMAVQVTHFPNHGLSIGLAFHHVILDGQSFNLFLKSWAHISNKMDDNSDAVFCTLPPQLTPSFERGPNVLRNPFDFVPPRRSVKFNTKVLPPSNWVRATFQLTPTHVQKLKKRVLEEIEEEEEELHLSTFVVAYAYALTCLLKAKEGECKQLVHLGFAVDVRGLLDPPVSSNYFGNCIIHPGTKVEARELREHEDGFTNIAKKLSHLILETRRTRTVKVPTLADVIEFHTNYSSRLEICTVADSPKYKLYETDFGWGNPSKVEMISLGNNNISLLDTKDGGCGVEIGLVLPNHHQLDTFTSLFAQGS